MNWIYNIWMGVLVEDERVVECIDFLRNIKVYIKFLFLELLIGLLLNLNLKKINWVIVGGESGLKVRLMDEDWVFDIYN